jgi:hypothetical protein
MLEVWICKEEPSVRLMVPSGATMPANLGNRDWQLIGPFEGSAEVARQVAEKGYFFITSGEAGPPFVGLEDANPADRQFDVK